MRKTTLLCAAGASMLIGSAAQAAIVSIINDNFDSYANQAAFEAAWPAIGTVAPTSGALSTLQASSPTQSIQGPASATNGQYRNQRIFAETSTLSSSGNLGIGDVLTWSFDYFDSAPTGQPARNYANLQDSTAPGATNQLIAMGLNNNQVATNSGGQFYMARILGYDPIAVADPDGGPAETVGGSGAFFKLNDFGAGARTAGFHNLKVLITTDDGLSTDFAFYVDSVLAERVNNVGTAASIRSYDNIRIGSGLTNAATEVFFDNMFLQYDAVPEPAAFATLGMVAMGMLARRSRN